MGHTQSPGHSARQARRPDSNSVTAELPSELQHWLDDFGRHLSQVVGLAPRSRHQYCFYVRRFLAQYGEATALAQWVPRGEWLSAFVRQEAARLHGHSRKQSGNALRAWLKYLVFCGTAGSELKDAIPAMPHWKYASLPVRLTADQIERMLAASLDGSAHELRNRAMLLFLARIGLRAQELTQLMLDDWARAACVFVPASLIVNAACRCPMMLAKPCLPTFCGNAPAVLAEPYS